MNSFIKALISKLELNGWVCRHSEGKVEFPKDIKARYPWIPAEILELSIQYEELVRSDEQLWLLTAADYSGTNPSSYAWNAWELLSIEAAEGDPEQLEEINTFWNDNLPIAISLDDGYAFYSITKDGDIMYGREPMFEETDAFAPNYEAFLQHVGSRT